MTALPEWSNSCRCDSDDCDIGKVCKALAVAWEALEQMSSWPNQQIAESAMRRITKLGKE